MGMTGNRKAAAVLAVTMLVVSGCAGKRVEPVTTTAAETTTAAAEPETELHETADESVAEAPDSIKGTEIPGISDMQISEVILEKNEARYPAGYECTGEGHYLMGYEKSKDTVRAYVLTMYGAYQFQDGNLVKAAGSGVIPAVLTFTADGGGGFSISGYEEPRDGEEYLSSTQELFPEEFWELSMMPDDKIRDSIEKQEKGYAEKYLASIGREALIGDYGDFSHPLLTEQGVAAEISNQLISARELAAYPDWIGNIEALEDGVRYRYETAYEKDRKEVCFTRTAAETGEVVEQIRYDSETGERKG